MNTTNILPFQVDNAGQLQVDVLTTPNIQGSLGEDIAQDTDTKALLIAGSIDGGTGVGKGKLLRVDDTGHLQVDVVSGSVTVSSLEGTQADNTPVNLAASNAGSLFVQSAMSNRKLVQCRSSTIYQDQTTIQDMSTMVAGIDYPYHWTAQNTVKVVSTSTADDATGVGAKEITVCGLDLNFDEVCEAIATSGITAAVGSQVFLRVTEAYVSATGSDRRNAGIVSIKDSPGNTVTEIQSGKGRTRDCVYTVPRNKRAYMDWITMTVPPDCNAQIRCYYSEHASDAIDAESPRIELFEVTGLQGTFTRSWPSARELDDLTDVWCTAECGGVNGPYQVLVEFSMVTEDIVAADMVATATATATTTTKTTVTVPPP